MKKELKLGKRLLSLALTLAVALTFTVTAPEAAFATETSTLSIGSQASGTLTGGYTTNVTPQTSSDGTLYKVYTITFTSTDATATALVPPTAKGGTFGTVTTSGKTSTVTYTVSSNATLANVTFDLSAITYKGAGKVTIKAGGTPTLEKADQAGTHYDDVEYNGHIYRLWKAQAYWINAMYASIETEGATYKGYKGHPLTITSKGEYDFINNNLLSNLGSDAMLWLGAVPASNNDMTEMSYIEDHGEEVRLPLSAYTVVGNGNGSGWVWLPETPEGKGNTSQGDKLPNNKEGENFWSSGRPNGCGTEGSDDYTYVVCMRKNDGWHDFTKENVKVMTCYYITEYTPYYNNAWQSAAQAEEKSQSFSDSNVKAVGIDYEAETFTGLLEGTNYTVTGISSALTASGSDNTKADATLALVKTTDGAYSIIGSTDTDITVTREGSAAAQTIKVPARKVVSLTEENDVTKYSTKLVVAVPNDGYEYQYKIGEGDWVTDTDNDGKIVFDKLKSSTTYTITVQVPASNDKKVFASVPVSIDVKTLPKYGQTSATTEEENTITKDLDTAKTEAKSDVTKVASETYDTAEAAEVKAIKEQAEKDIAAATTVAEVNKIKAEAEAEIEAIPTAAEKAEKKAVQSITSKNLKAKSKKIKKNGKTAVKLTWNAPSGVKLDGYVIYRSTKKSTLGKKAYDTTTKTSYTNAKNLKKGNTYYYKIKGYKVINGEKVYTGTSTRAYQKIK